MELNFKAVQRGFTLVELVVVLVILAIIGAIIAPRLFDLAGPARFAAVKSLQASISAAAQLAHALQVSQGLAANANVTVEGSPITMAFGWPTEDAAGIQAAVQFDTTVFTTSLVGGTWEFRTQGAATPGNCAVRYNAPAAAGGVPAITLNTGVATGCD